MAWKKLTSSKGSDWKLERYVWEGSKKENKYKCIWTPITAEAKKFKGKHTTYHKYYPK